VGKAPGPILVHRNAVSVEAQDGRRCAYEPDLAAKKQRASIAEC
jgi:hypothetical protein